MSRKKSCAGVWVADHYPVGAFDTSKAKTVKPLKHKDLLLAEVEKFVSKGKAAQKAVEKITNKHINAKLFGGPTTSIRLTAPERDTILAALRMWQRTKNRVGFLMDIATNGGDHEALSNKGIDALCEDLNQ